MGNRHELILIDAAARVQVIYTAERGYRFWMVYNDISLNFICGEPQPWLSHHCALHEPAEEAPASFAPIFHLAASGAQD